jgi:hypothetical protein
MSSFDSGLRVKNVLTNAMQTRTLLIFTESDDFRAFFISKYCAVKRFTRALMTVHIIIARLYFGGPMIDGCLPSIL